MSRTAATAREATMGHFGGPGEDRGPCWLKTSAATEEAIIAAPTRRPTITVAVTPRSRSPWRSTAEVSR